MADTIYMNRELSWLKFNERVLEEAENPENPLCERLTFASIYQSNLDEFYMVRVGSLVDQMLLAKDIRENKTNMIPKEQLDAILARTKKLNRKRDVVYEEIMESLEEYGVHMLNFHKIEKEDRNYLERYFEAEVAPVISPSIVGKRQPFPFLRNKEIYAVVVLETKKGKEKLGIIPCSSAGIQRLIPVPGKTGTYMLSEELILHFVSKIFKGYHIKAKSLLRITRNADIDADALYDEDLDYREFMVELIKARKKLAPIRLELSREMDGDVVETLCDYLEVDKNFVFRGDIPLDLSFVFQIQDGLRKRTELFYEKRIPQKSPVFNSHEPILDQIAKKDRFLSYPYESIKPFLTMLHEAARVFQALAMGETVEDMDYLLVAPKCLQNKVLAMIDEEIEHAKAGEQAYIGLKMNSLTDKRIMNKLVEASCAGVHIDMVVRGICCLIPGVKGQTENIHIISIVGRFLEHSRIYIFGTQERAKIYISSADFMTRNTLRRVEVAAPIEDPDIRMQIQEMFVTMLSDNRKARTMNNKGNYKIEPSDNAPLNSQEVFLEQAYDNAAPVVMEK